MQPDRDAVTIALDYQPPFDRASLLRFVARRAIPGVEEVADATIRRSVRPGLFGAAAGWVEARFDPRAPRVWLSVPASLAPAGEAVGAAVRCWLDLDAQPQAIDAALADLPGGPGTRLPGGLDAFELAVRAVLGQQVTVTAARTLARRFVERFGTEVRTPWSGIVHAFPAPDAVAAQRIEAIAELGIIRSRAGAILALATAWPELERAMAGQAPDELVERLRALPGIGPWTAHYVAMRATGWHDAFPPGDVAVRNAARTLFGAATPGAVQALAARWQPWRSYAVLRLWDSLEQRL